jgi:hypothetical protein
MLFNQKRDKTARIGAEKTKKGKMFISNILPAEKVKRASQSFHF